LNCHLRQYGSSRLIRILKGHQEHRRFNQQKNEKINFFEKKIATEGTARPLAATKSEALNPKSETNSNEQKKANSKQNMRTQGFDNNDFMTS